MASNKGITLIELLIVIVIVGILAAIAIPSYTGYMVRARRADAKTALEQVRAAQEMWRAERGAYATDGGGVTAEVRLQNTMGAPAPHPARVGDYSWAFTVKTVTAFTARATPQTGRQAADGWLEINHLGAKTSQHPDRWAK